PISHTPFVSVARTNTTSPEESTGRSVVIFVYSEFNSGFGLRAQAACSSGITPSSAPMRTLTDSFSTEVTSAAMTSSRLPSPSRNACSFLLKSSHPLFEHPPQHVHPARLRALRMRERRVLARRLRQPGDQRNLRQRQLPDVLAEVVLRRGLHSVAVVTEVHLVQVQPEDVLLVEVVLQPPGEDELARLAPDAWPAGTDADALLALDGGHDRLGRLLRERRAADGPGVAHVRLVDASHQPGEADTAVLEEVLVLAGDDRLLEALGNPVVGNHHPALVVELADHLLV